MLCTKHLWAKEPWHIQAGSCVWLKFLLHVLSLFPEMYVRNPRGEGSGSIALRRCMFASGIHCQLSA